MASKGQKPSKKAARANTATSGAVSDAATPSASIVSNTNVNLEAPAVAVPLIEAPATENALTDASPPCAPALAETSAPAVLTTQNLLTNADLHGTSVLALPAHFDVPSPHAAYTASVPIQQQQNHRLLAELLVAFFDGFMDANFLLTTLTEHVPSHAYYAQHFAYTVSPADRERIITAVRQLSLHVGPFATLFLPSFNAYWMHMPASVLATILRLLTQWFPTITSIIPRLLTQDAMEHVLTAYTGLSCMERWDMLNLARLPHALLTFPLQLTVQARLDSTYALTIRRSTSSSASHP